MKFYKKYNNGLQVIIEKMESLYSVSAGVLVKTGSANESESENGISHFIEHNLFKGTTTRSSFEISDYIDRIGAQINAFTSKEITCYYTKSTSEHLDKALDVLSDIFFNSVFDKAELDKERGVILEEINMSIDAPEDYCLDLLAKAYHGERGLGRTILGSAKNIRRFNKEDIYAYMDKYYTADNVVISIAGNVDENQVFDLIEKLFVEKFTRLKSKEQIITEKVKPSQLFKSKKTEQTHVSFAFPGLSVNHPKSDELSIANIVFGGGMSSRLFQKVREQMGLCYTVYSYLSQYKDQGVMEIYAGVSNDARDKAVKAIVGEIDKIKAEGITTAEFERAKEQIKSAFIMGRESTASQMLLFGRYLLIQGKQFDFDERIDRLNSVTLEGVNQIIKECFDKEKMASATLGKLRTPLSF